MKIFMGNQKFMAGALAGGLLAATAGVGLVSAQTAPGLAIVQMATNQISVTVTNGISTDSYELWWTPSIGDTADYPWTTAAVGAIGQTNFILPNWEYSTVFFRGLLDTNAIPLWEAANPNNPGTNILKITIASPANGSSLN